MPPVRTALALAALLAVPASAVAASVEIAPTSAVERFQARVDTEAGSAVLRWGGPERFSFTPLGPTSPIERIVRNGGLETSGGRGGAVIRRTYAAGPDGFTALDLVDPSVETLLARARAGATPLTPGRIGARATLRGSVRLGPNDCAGERGGVRTIDLDARTLLPVRIETRRSGARTSVVRLTGLRLDPAFGAGAFRPVRPTGVVFRADRRFRRVAPAVAAAHLPYLPEIPAVVPDGFRRVVTGWAPRSAITGPEGSIPARPSLFAAVYARGVERIEITQRASSGRDWPEDPFAGECRPQTATTVTVNGVTASYAYGPETGPHLYWRDGAVLFTVSGPFPAEDLAAVAASLGPVTS